MLFLEEIIYICKLLPFVECLIGEMMLYVDDDFRREELIRNIERQIEQMTLRQLEMLYYELSTKDYSSDSNE